MAEGTRHQEVGANPLDGVQEEASRLALFTKDLDIRLYAPCRVIGLEALGFEMAGTRLWGCEENHPGGLFKERQGQSGGPARLLAAIPGDGDGDGVLTAADAMTALRMSVRLVPERMAMDVDGDGRVTSDDAREILRRVVGQ